MTYQNCERLAEHFESLGNVEEAKAYRERAERKKKKLGIVDSKEDKSKGKK